MRTNISKNDTFDSDIENIFLKLTEIAIIKNSSSNISINEYSNGSYGTLTKIQSFILKYSISLLPILIQSKRYSMQKISEFYIGFLQSRFILNTQFLTKFIRTKLFETQGLYYKISKLSFFILLYNFEIRKQKSNYGTIMQIVE